MSDPTFDVSLDRERCQGHGRCYVLAPEVYGADDDGYGVVVQPRVSGQQHEAALRGANNCPEDAITITGSE